MISDREVRVANWLIKDGGEYVIDEELYYANEKTKDEIQAYAVEIEGDLGGDSPADTSVHFGPIEWRKSYTEISSEIQDRNLSSL